MGFKFKRIDLVVGSADFPSEHSYNGKLARSKTIVSKCAEAIINCNCGWQLDSTKSSSLTDYSLIATRGYGTDRYPALFLTNTTSGCKLMIAYFATEPNWGIYTYSPNTDQINASSYGAAYITGLIMCMIPAGSSSTFGGVDSISFIPSDATRVVGTHNYYDAYTNDYCCFAGNPTSGYVYSWGLFVSSEVIAVSCIKNQSSPGNFKTPVFAIGKVIGTLSNSSDTSNQARYGVILFRESDNNTAQSEGMTDVINLSRSLYGYNGSASNFVGKDPNTNTFSNCIGAVNVCGAITKDDGSWINGTNGSSYCVTIYPVDVYQLSGNVYSSLGGSRWTPFAIRCISTDLATYSVASGDGMKGYLDTDLFRCGISTYGQTFDGGNFICVDSTYNFLIGWDPNNTDQLAGT